MTESEMAELVECYKLGCLIAGKPVDNDAILDLINTAKAVSVLYLLINMVLLEHLPIIFEDKKLSIVVEKADSLKFDKAQ
jgi:hypothetical protein